MAKSSREIPKEIAAFGERQFKETGAAMVEVLRVKTSVMRKHFKKLKGITFLVAVVSLDRIRVYFFNAAGTILVGENVDTKIYSKIRRDSKLIAKFEKPRELTPEELRIEATQDLRDSLAKAIRRISRALATGEPPFPDIFITRTRQISSSHSFGVQLGENSELLFEESAMGDKSAQGIISRAAFLTLLEDKTANFEMANIVGNGMALFLLKESDRKPFLEQWRKKSTNSESIPIMNHIITHAQSYSSSGFSRILSLLRESSQNFSNQEWIRAIDVIHHGTHITLGTEDYHTIRGFCGTLLKPRKLENRRHVMESIHLAPRVICDPTPLGTTLTLSCTESDEKSWLEIEYIQDQKIQRFSVADVNGDAINSIDYWLNLEDVYPSAGGLIPHGKDIIRTALSQLGVSTISPSTFVGRIEFTDRQLNSAELAVLERLASGSLEVLANTLVGSPQVIDSLLKKGQIALWPSFNHIGVNPDFLLQGEHNAIMDIVRSCCLEGTVISTDSEATAVVSAPNSWKNTLIQTMNENGPSLWLVRSISSPRNILRDEQSFSYDETVFTWSEGAI
ncbi:MAG: hypothetical protein ACFFF9_03245 [Candidatus Thorarchaeota archaeon]